jgi:hypothetical protein
MKSTARARMKKLGKKVRAASERALKKTGMSQAKAKRVVRQVKRRAASIGQTTGTMIESATKAAAMAAGVVVGTAQALMPEPSPAQPASSPQRPGASQPFKDDTRTNG